MGFHDETMRRLVSLVQMWGEQKHNHEHSDNIRYPFTIIDSWFKLYGNFPTNGMMINAQPDLDDHEEEEEEEEGMWHSMHRM